MSRGDERRRRNRRKRQSNNGERDRFEQGCATLEPGDVVVAFTDGVSEAMNAADEEWGEAQLIAAVRPHPTLEARDLIHRIMQDADAFVAGAPQHDDMTAVVIRLV